MLESDEQPIDERAERRERRQQAAREAMRKHGAKLGEMYRNAVQKRARKAGSKPKRKAAR